MDENFYRHIFKKLLEITDDGFVVTDKNEMITDINEQYCSFLNVSREEAIGKHVSEIISVSNIPQLMKTNSSEEGHITSIGEDSGFTEDAVVITNRAGVTDDSGKIIGGFAQVKFRLQTMDSAQKFMKKYRELEYYRDEYLKNTGRYFEEALGASHAFEDAKKQGERIKKDMISEAKQEINKVEQETRKIEQENEIISKKC